MIEIWRAYLILPPSIETVCQETTQMNPSYTEKTTSIYKIGSLEGTLESLQQYNTTEKMSILH